MNRSLRILRGNPGMTVQDQGRPGGLALGLSRGGAVDLLALDEGAALLGQSADCACIEMPGIGSIFEAGDEALRIALTGAPMQVTLDGEPIAWNASHRMHPGQRLSVGGARRGVYGYLHLGGGIATDLVMGARSAHTTAGIGAALQDGDDLPIGEDLAGDTGMVLGATDRFSGGVIRIVPSVQTDRFDADDLKRLEETAFARDPRSNRMGVRLKFEGANFVPSDQLNVLSEVVVPGDIQATGDGPYVLLSDCQTTGGYPRIATVLPCDIPRIAQTATGTLLRFRFVDRAEAMAAHRQAAADTRKLAQRIRPLIRDPHAIKDLLSYQLIDGVVAGNEDLSNEDVET